MTWSAISVRPYKQEGVAALWTGITPNVMRNSIINAAELAGRGGCRPLPHRHAL
jgi:hypothetical protein